MCNKQPNPCATDSEIMPKKHDGDCLTWSCTLKRVAVSGTMPLILIRGSRGRGIGSMSERYTLSLSAKRACNLSVCRDTQDKMLLWRHLDHRSSLFLHGSLVLTFFLRFPLSLCTAFISCTSLSTKVCWAASSERITLTLLSPWTEIGEGGQVCFAIRPLPIEATSFFSILFCAKRRRQSC